MAITRRWQAGIGPGNLSEFTGVTGAANASSVQAKTGTYSLQVGTLAGRYGYVDISATRQIRVGLYFNPMAISTTTEVSIVSVLQDTTTQLVGLHQKGTSSNSPLILDVAGTDQDTEVNSNTPSTWFHLGLDIKIDSSAGWFVVYKDGLEILRFEGNTGNADIVRVCFGTFLNAPGVQQYLDDMYIDDTTGESAPAVCPILYFQYLTPNGNGNYNGGADQWTGSDTNKTDNYLLVDEIPPNNDADYVEAVAADKIDSYALTTYTLAGNETCVAVIPLVVCERTGATEQIAIGTRSGSDAIGSDQTISTSYQSYTERQTTKPGGGAWDQAAIDALEVVIKSRGTYA